jgi:hypothetical protein
MRDKFVIQRASLQVMYIAIPMIVVAKAVSSGQTRLGFLALVCGLLLLMSLLSIAATLISGIAIGTGFLPYDRRTRFGPFCFILAVQVTLCCACVFGVIQWVHGLNKVW